MTTSQNGGVEVAAAGVGVVANVMARIINRLKPPRIKMPQQMALLTTTQMMPQQLAVMMQS